MFYLYELSIMTMKSVYIVYITNCFYGLCLIIKLN